MGDDAHSRAGRWVLCMVIGWLLAGTAALGEAPLPQEEPDTKAASEEEGEEEASLALPGPVAGMPDDEATEPDPLPELWFPMGEEIEYRVYWGRIPVGTAVISTEWEDDEEHGPLVAIRVEVVSNRVIETLYPVDIRIESLIDPSTFLPVRFTQDRKEGRRHTHEITEFDYDNLIAHWRSLSRDREDTFELEPDTRDLLSFAYYMRKKGFQRNERREFRVMADDKIYDLWLESRGTDAIRLRHYGRVSSVEVEPEAAFEGLFVRRGRIQFWVSRDERQLMTQMVGSIPVASIRLVLQRVRGPGNDSWILDYNDD